MDSFVAALTDELDVRLPVAWVDLRLLDGLLVVALDSADDDEVELAVVGAVEAAEVRAGIEGNPFPEHRHGAPVDDEPLLRAAAEVAADVFAFGLSATLRAVRAPRPPAGFDLDGLVGLVQNVPGLRRTLGRWVGRGTAEAGAGVAYALAGGLAQNFVGPVLGFAYHNLRLGELRARQAAWLEAEPRLYGPGPISAASSEPVERPLPRPPGPVERFAELTWVASLGTFVATIPLTGSIERALSVLASGAPKAARIGREAFGSHLSRDLGQRGIVVLRPGTLRLLDQIDVVVVEDGLFSGEDGARLERVAAANGLRLVAIAPDGPAEVRRLQIAGHVVATVGGPSFTPLAAGDLPIGVAGRDGRMPDGSHVMCLGGLADATRVLAAARSARQASQESAHFSLAGAVGGALAAVTPIVGSRLPRVMTVIDSAALLAVGNAVRHARHAESLDFGGGPGRADEIPVLVAVPDLITGGNGQEAASA